MAVSLGVFVEQYTGRCVTHPGYSPANQCVDLIAFWVDNIGYAGLLHGSASAYAGERYAPRLTWVPSSGSNMPVPGDILVWGAPVATSADGHTDIFISGSAGSFNTFDQNWCGGGGGGCCCKVVNHRSKAGLIGWQHPASLGVAPVPVPTPGPPAPISIPVFAGSALALAAIIAGGVAFSVYERRRHPEAPGTSGDFDFDHQTAVRHARRGGSAAVGSGFTA